MTETDGLPSVSDDAPPAILFRLSYRANENHRSGYRTGDDRDRIVASMRGWWELDPDEVKSLNIKYAVAFHRGETRAVAEIDSWKWQDVPGSDHNTFEADEGGYPYEDDRWRGRGRRALVLLSAYGEGVEGGKCAEVRRGGLDRPERQAGSCLDAGHDRRLLADIADRQCP